MSALDISTWPQEWQDALSAYAAAKGKNWIEHLSIDWATGQDEHFPEYGHILRQIRNHPIHGPQIIDAVWGEGTK